MSRRLPQSRVRSPLAGAWAAVVVAVSVLTTYPLPARGQHLNQLPEAVQGMEIQDTRGEQVPLDLSMINSTGEAVRLGEYFDGKRPVVLVMMYTSCPVVCPTVIQETMRALNEIDFTLGQQYRAVFVSFDPRDTPEVLATEREVALLGYKQARTTQVEEGFAFLGSTVQSGEALGKALGFPFRYLPESREYSHPTGIYLLTPDGRVSRYLGGLSYPAATVRLGLLEAGEGKIGSVFDKVTLWCFHFDPKEGSYTLQAFRVMQIGATLTALLLGSLVAGLAIGERRRRRRRLKGGAAEGSDQTMSNTPPAGRTS